VNHRARQNTGSSIRRIAHPLRAAGSTVDETQRLDTRLQQYWLLTDSLIASIPPYPAGRFQGRGIVICGGGSTYFTCAWVAVNMLRHVGCKLPVELWYLDDSEMTQEMTGIMESVGVTCCNAARIREEHPVRQLGGWELKPYAIINSRFQEVLLLDADNTPVTDPAYLFETHQYLRHRAVFWPDYGRLAPDQAAWRAFNMSFRREPDFESGQVLVDKRACWNALQLTMHYNEHSDHYYRYVHGDKDTYHMAWRRLEQAYAMPKHVIHNLDNKVMCQHDFSGQVIFQHRNLAKWKLPAEANEKIPGFQHEEVCLDCLRRLQSLWTGNLPTADIGDLKTFAATIASIGQYTYVSANRRRCLWLLPDRRVLGLEDDSRWAVIPADRSEGMILTLTRRGKECRYYESPEGLFISMTHDNPPSELVPHQAVLASEHDLKSGPRASDARDAIERLQSPAHFARTKADIRLAVVTTRRNPEYVHATIASLFASTQQSRELHSVDLIADVADTQYLWQYEHHARIRIHRLSEDAQKVHSSRHIWSRCCYNHWRALSLPLDGYRGLVVLEDDVLLRDDFLEHLFGAVDDLERRRVKTYILSLYTRLNLRPQPTSPGQGNRAVPYPASLYYGSQATYYPKSVLPLLRSYVWQHGVNVYRQPFDELLKEVALKHGFLYNMAFDLAEHVGEVSTGLAGCAYAVTRSQSFYRPATSLLEQTVQAGPADSTPEHRCRMPLGSAGSPAESTMPTVLFSSLYPADPMLRQEFRVLDLLAREYAEGNYPFRLEFLLASAHRTVALAAQRILQKYPMYAQCFHLVHGYSGYREGEITCGKQLLAKLWESQTYDYLWYMDSDMWMSCDNIVECIRVCQEKPTNRVAKLPCPLRDLGIISPASFAGFVHHKSLLLRTQYGKVLFPSNGVPGGGEDCRLQYHLMDVGCEVVPVQVITQHHDFEGWYWEHRNGACSRHRIESGSMGTSPSAAICARRGRTR